MCRTPERISEPLSSSANFQETIEPIGTDEIEAEQIRVRGTGWEEEEEVNMGCRIARENAGRRGKFPFQINNG